MGPALLGGLALLGACSGDEGPLRPGDRVPPQVTIVQPVENGVVRSARPSFLIRVSDGGSGVFCPSLSATISGADASQAFLSGCDDDLGEVRARNPGALAEGPNTLVFRIGDRDGNVTTVTRIFVVETDTNGPPAD